MTAPKPPPRTLQPAEERKIQLFLERAAPIVLENPHLTAERWQFLAALAHDFDLTANQFRSTIDDLLNRGVIKGLEVTPPKPPPLPGRRGAAAMAAPVEDNISEDFALSPPGAPQPEQKSPVPKSPPLAEARETLESFHQPADDKATHETVAVAIEKPVATRWRVEGSPAPVLPPPPKPPAETYLDFARPSLAAVRDGVVSEEMEQRLIAHGTRVLGLSAVYARHLLLDLVAERKLRLASGAEAALQVAAPAATSTPADPRLAEFLQAAKPILAQHRGLNSHSRVRLTALARERGLTEQDADLAMESFTAREPEEPIDRVKQERLAPFRLQVESGLKKAPRGILTPALNDKFVTAGIELFGLDGEMATAVVREITGKLQLTVITHEQAERHLTDLLSEMFSASVELTRSQRDRIELEGAQWGLPAARVTSLIDENCRQNALKSRADQRVTRWALAGAVVMLGIVVAFFVWTAIARNNRHEAPFPKIPVEPPSVSERKPEKPEREDSWLDAHSDLAILLQMWLLIGKRG